MTTGRSMPMPDQGVEALFLQALEVPLAERAAWIIQACAGNEALSAEVTALLAADANNTDGALCGPMRRPVGELPIALGDYRFEAEIAHGGMGTVYRAVHGLTGRPTAIKLLRFEFGSEKAELRFQLEAETLAHLSHDGIARIYDAGIASVRWPGREHRCPFIAMELVDGVDLRSFAASLDDRRKLALVGQVARTLAHAHQRGVIHRDLKPANVLVTAGGLPKILDFGIARRSDRSTDAPDLTLEGQLIGSLRYMSPEQARGDISAIDTRSDIFALGVILYELLAGKTPHDLPPLPTPSAIARVQTEPAQLRSHVPRIPRDIEAIVHKAMALDPAERYASAAALAQDIEGYLSGRTIVARPPTLRVQLARLARRHRVAAVSVVAVLLAVAGVAVAATLYASRLAREVQATRRAVDDATATVKFLDEMLRSVEPRAVGREVSLLDVLERGARRLHTLEHRPTIYSEMMALLLHAYTHQGVPSNDPRVPPELWGDSAVARAEVSHVHTRAEVDAMFQRALAYSQGAEHHLADTGLRTAARWYRDSLGPTQFQTLLAEAALAEHLSNLDFEAEGLQLLRSVVERARAALGEGDRRTLEFSVQLAITIYDRFGDVGEARALSADLVPRLQAASGPDDRATLENAAHLGRMLDYAGEREESIALLEHTAQRALAALGVDDMVTVTAQRHLALAYQGADRREDALRLYVRLLPVVESVYGERDRRTVLTRAHWARLLVELGQPADAEQVARENLEQRLFEWQLERGRDIAHSWSALGLARLALAERASDAATGHTRRAEGLANLRRALDCALAHNPPDHVEVALHLLTLADALETIEPAAGRAETLELTKRAHAIVTTQCGEDSPAAGDAHQRMLDLKTR